MRGVRAAHLVAAALVLAAPLVAAVSPPAAAAPASKPAAPGAPLAESRASTTSSVELTAVVANGALAGVDTDENLRCSVQRAGFGQEFYGTWSCGTNIAVDGTLYGHLGAYYSLVSQATTGAGTASSPWLITTEVALGETGIRAVQVDRVVDGDSGYSTSVMVHNDSATSHTVLVYRTGDCFVAGSDYGYGELTSTGVACVSSDRANYLTWTPITPNATRLEDSYSANYSAVESLEPLPNACMCDSAIDNGMSLRWSRDLGVGSAVEFSSRLDLVAHDSPPPSQFDTDGDGLPDDWETSGAKDANGNVTYNLPGLGASPQRKDIFLYVESERDAPLSATARQQLTAAFNSAPVANPDGTTGIRVHFVNGRSLTYAASDSIRASFGTPAAQDWHAIWNRWLSSAPLGPSVFHYVLSVAWDGGGWSGNGSRITGIGSLPGQMLILNNCGPRNTTRTTCATTATDQAANLMHELGHNLGLRHGGGDDINYKPNYPSVMNYFFSHTGVPGAGLTYSRWGSETFYNLDENSLAERDGLLLRQPVPSGLGTAWLCQNSGARRTAIMNRPLDWNCNGSIQTARVGTNINGRTNGSFVRQVLTPFNDWANIALTSNEDNLGFSTVAYREGETQF
jgi:hypothetical protein